MNHESITNMKRAFAAYLATAMVVSQPGVVAATEVISNVTGAVVSNGETSSPEVSAPVISGGVSDTVDTSTEVETTPEAEATPELETAPEVEATPEVETTPEVEATPEVNTSLEVEAEKEPTILEAFAETQSSGLEVTASTVSSTTTAYSLSNALIWGSTKTTTIPNSVIDSTHTTTGPEPFVYVYVKPVSTWVLLTKGTDYSITYDNALTPGNKTMTITAMGNTYNGSITKDYAVWGLLNTATTKITGDNVTYNTDGIAEFEYTGGIINNIGVESVTLANGQELTSAQYLTTEHGNGSNVGTYHYKISGISTAYTYSTSNVWASYKITAVDLSSKVSNTENDRFSITWAEDKLAYTGAAVWPTAITVTDSNTGKVLTLNTDYTIAYTTASKLTDTGKITITGKGNYTGSIAREYTLSSDGDLFTSSNSNFTTSTIAAQVFYGTNYTAAGMKSGGVSPKIFYKVNNAWTTLTENTDYTAVVVHQDDYAAYQALSDAGKASYVEEEKAGTVGKNYYIVTGIGDTYANSSYAVEYIVWGNFTLLTDSNFQYTYTDNGAEVPYNTTNFTYTGSVIEPNLKTITYQGYEFVEGKHYTITKNSTNATNTGIYYYQIVPVASEYTYTSGTAKKWASYNIVADQLGYIKPVTTQAFTGQAVQPELTVYASSVYADEAAFTAGGGSGTALVLGTDYTVSYSNNIAQSSSATATITGKGGYTGNTATVTFTIGAASTDDASKLFETGYHPAISDKYFYGTAFQTSDILDKFYIRPDGKTWILLTQGKDYTVSLTNAMTKEDSTNYDGGLPGKNSLVFTGIGDYDGAEWSIDFNIVGVLTDAVVTLDTTEAAGYDATAEGYTWTGDDIKPEILSVKLGDYEVPSNGYTITYYNKTSLTNVGTCYAGIDAAGDYFWTKSTNWNKTYDITPDSFDESFVASIGDQLFTGTNVQPTITVYNKDVSGGNGDATELTLGTDYSVTYYNNINATPENPTDDDKAYAVIKGLNGYAGSEATVYFSIGTTTDNLLAEATVQNVTWKSFTGNPITGDDFTTIKVYVRPGASWVLLEEGTDFEVTIRHDDASTSSGTPGTNYYVITGIGAYENSSYEAEFEVYADLSSDNVDAYFVDDNGDVLTEALIYTGSAFNPDFVVEFQDDDGNITFTANQDNVSALYKTSPINEGTHTATLYSTLANGFIEKKYAYADFDIVKTGLTDSNTTITITDYDASDYMNFTGSAIKPTIEVTYVDEDNASHTLEESTDYTITYSNNTAPCATSDENCATITITGVGIYSGSVDQTFTIKMDSTATFEVADISKVAYTGNEITPTPKVTVTLNAESGVEDSGITRTLVSGVDFTYSYANNTDIGKTASVTVTGMGSYESLSPETVDFTITGSIDTYSTIYMLDGTNILSETDQAYTGSQITPSIKVMVDNVELSQELYDDDGNITTQGDYSIEYGTNTQLGTGTIKITATDSAQYAGSKTMTFKIVAISLAETNTFAGEDNDGTFSIAAITESYTTGYITPTPAIAVKDGDTYTILTKDIDYTLSYSNNINVSDTDPKIIVTGKGNYSGTVEIGFSIGVATGDVFANNISVTGVGEQDFTGSALTPSGYEVSFKNPTTGVSTTLVENTDYTIAFSDNTNPGVATMTITGINNYVGSSYDHEFDIVVDLSQAALATSSGTNQFSWTGKAIDVGEDITINGVSVAEYVDFTIFQNEYKPATYSVIANGKSGNSYVKGTQTLDYTIEPLSITTANISVVAQLYTGSLVQPTGSDVTVTINGVDVTLVQGTHYTLSWGDSSTNIGGEAATDNAKITATAIDGFGLSGSLEGTFTISGTVVSDLLNNAVVTGLSEIAFADGHAVSGAEPATTPVITTTINGESVDITEHFNITYINNKTPGTATMVATGTGGVYVGETITKDYYVTGTLAEAVFTVTGGLGSLSYEGKLYDAVLDTSLYEVSGVSLSGSDLIISFKPTTASVLTGTNSVTAVLSGSGS